MAVKNWLSQWCADFGCKLDKRKCLMWKFIRINLKNSKAARDLIVIGIIAVILFSLGVVFDLVEELHEITREYEYWEIDEIILLFMLFSFSFAIFSWRRWKELQLEVFARHRLEIQLRETMDELIEGREALIRTEKLSSIGVLAAGAAHEILTPAAVIQMRAELIALDTPDDSPENLSADIIIQHIARIKNICNEMRVFSREENAPMEQFDPCGPLRSSLSLISHEFSPAGIETALNLGESNFVVMGSQDQLQQVFVNLFSNARDAMPNGGTISISSGDIESRDKRYWELKVSDTGCGISKDVISKIFDPFYTTKEPDKGTGLGLSVVHGIVKTHGGDIFAESEEGQGATFTVRLPYAMGKDA